MSEPTCNIHHVQMEFFGYIPAPGSDIPGEDWRCSACEKSLRRKLQSIPKDHWLMIGNAPRAHHMMTGIHSAGIRSDGIIRAEYEDGTEREGMATDRVLDSAESDFNLLSVASALSTEDAPEWPESSGGGDSESYRAAMKDAGRGHLLR